MKYLFVTILLLISSIVLAANERMTPFPPFQISDHIYYVGTEFQASYLLTSTAGNILINTDEENNVPFITKSIKQLGFKLADIKIILTSHAHSDHVGGAALLKQLTGAQLMIMQNEVDVVESGGKTDFAYGIGSKERHLFTPAKVDRVLHDEDQVRLGQLVLTAHLTAGHSKGNTTWTFVDTIQGAPKNVVIIGSLNVNPRYILKHNKKYPTIAQDYHHSFAVLKKLPCDIFLGAHGVFYHLKEKYAKLNTSDVNPFIDPQGYKHHVKRKENDFKKELARA